MDLLRRFIREALDKQTRRDREHQKRKEMEPFFSPPKGSKEEKPIEEPEEEA